MPLDEIKDYFKANNEKEGSKHTQTKENVLNTPLNAQEVYNKRIRELFRKMQDDLTKSENLRIKINGDMKAGTDLNQILDDCLKCISLITGDEVFYRQNSRLLKKRND